jgi:succinyl-CoA synthetase beta subunit
VKKPIVVRMKGVRAKEANELLKDLAAEGKVYLEDDFDAAVETAVRISNKAAEVDIYELAL